MEGLVKEKESCPAIPRAVILRMLWEAYQYIAQKKRGNMKAFDEYVGVSRVAISDTVHGKNKDINIEIATKIFEYENIVRDEENEEWSRLLSKRLQYQTERAENEHQLNFGEQSLSYNNEVRALANVL